MSAYTIFNWKYGLTKVDVTPGSTDASGNWVAEVTVETAISGHLSDLTQKELSFIDPAIVQAGVRKLVTDKSVGLAVNDRIKVTEPSGEITEWMIHAKQSYSGLMDKHVGIKRETFLLKRRI